VPAFSTERFIGQTVRSVLEQSLEDLEVIVVDDCSTDSTASVVEAIDDPRLRVIRNEANLGAVANWNRAVSFTAGRYLKLVCGDDLLYPDCLAAQVAAMEAGDAGTVMAASPRDIIDEQGHVLIRSRGLSGMVGRVDGRTAIRAAVRSGSNPFGEPFCGLIRRDTVAAIGLFRGDHPYMVDLDYWCRALSIGDLVVVPETAGGFRLHSGSWSHRISTGQAAQTIAFYSDLRHDHPNSISATDLRVGAVRARLLALSRVLLYRFLAWRSSRAT
jgi:glycosyltransferase involved in cell wall biosynthesis